MKRPEYVSGVTRLYRTLLDEGRAPTRREVERVGTLFSRAGFTDGYYEGRTGRDMFGMRDERVPEKYESALAFERACVDRWAPSASPAARPVDFSLVVQEGRPASLTALCEGVSVTVEGPVPEAARTRPLTQEDALRALLRQELETAFARLCTDAGAAGADPFRFSFWAQSLLGPDAAPLPAVLQVIFA